MIEVHIRHGQASPHTGRLTDEGVDQARMAGAYLRKEFARTFEVGLHSPATRAAMTAQLLGLPRFQWVPDKHLREMAGESWEDAISRIGAVCDDLDARHPSQDRILVYHGDAMHAARAYREKLRGDRFQRLFEEPYKYFNNCQIIAYTDENPGDDGALRHGQLWVKSVCPWAEGRFGHDWMPVLT